ncbi:DUF4198 domain-containing protein [Bacillus sp. B15-48]|uniref:DUF4198 domain-containing protein n=1 Tax=Bacillus sp. B15-48 TaxID=1548601 RepID=UPI001EF30BAC|nr:DUF4198 domain-containing protein [Bacillus sp. B15-48]
MVHPPNAAAHELFIQVDENSDELRVDVLWGHIRDYVSEADVEDFQLFVRYPNGETEQLDLEAVGVHFRAYVPTNEGGDYTFWAIREPGTYTPDDGVPQLSVHSAKVIVHVGEGSERADEAVDADLEIVPNSDVRHFSTGIFSGTVLMDGSVAQEAAITAYGPSGEIVEAVTNSNGEFELPFGSAGTWLIKTNVKIDEAGTLGDEDYELISRTSTLIVDTEQPSNSGSSNNIGSLGAMLLIGLLVGGSVSMLALRKRQ